MRRSGSGECPVRGQSRQWPGSHNGLGQMQSSPELTWPTATIQRQLLSAVPRFCHRGQSLWWMQILVSHLLSTLSARDRDAANLSADCTLLARLGRESVIWVSECLFLLHRRKTKIIKLEKGDQLQEFKGYLTTKIMPCRF